MKFIVLPKTNNLLLLAIVFFGHVQHSLGVAVASGEMFGSDKLKLIIINCWLRCTSAIAKHEVFESDQLLVLHVTRGRVGESGSSNL